MIAILKIAFKALSWTLLFFMRPEVPFNVLSELLGPAYFTGDMLVA